MYSLMKIDVKAVYIQPYQYRFTPFENQVKSPAFTKNNIDI